MKPKGPDQAMMRQTERTHPASIGLDALPPLSILDHLLTQQQDALSAVRPALPALAAAATVMADAIRSGHRIAFAGAGSSALMAVCDGLELHGTFGVPAENVLLLMAGGLPVDANMPGDTEDDEDEALRAAARLHEGDAVVCVTASGSTPFALAIAKSARERGAKVIGLANNEGAPLFAFSDVAVCLVTPPEVVAGSTRMGAGTAQKAALNLISTLMGVKLGQVHDGRMVGVVADNAKLRSRATGIVSDIAGVAAEAARSALAAAAGEVKPAVLISLGLSPKQAAASLEAANGNLRAAMSRLTKPG